MINDVIIIYRIAHNGKKVLIVACYYANNEQSHEVFWEINPDEV